MDTKDLQFGPAQPINFTYNRQKALQSWSLRQHLNRRRIVLKNNNELDADDLLATNRLDENWDNYHSIGQSSMPNNQYEERYYQETYTLLNVSSRQRVQTFERQIVDEDRETFPHPEIWDEYWDPENSCFLLPEQCCETFNNLLGFQGTSPMFFVKDGQVFLRQPLNETTSQYKISLVPGYRHIRYIRLVSVEVPAEVPIINDENNLLLLDIIDPETGEKKDWDSDLPFILILVPPGKYTVCALLETIVRLLNQAVGAKDGEPLPFAFEYNERSGAVWIKSTLEFHLRFWFSPEQQIFNMHDMLGFPLPYPTDDELKPTFTKCWSNLIEKPSPLTTCGLTNCVPFKCPSTDIIRYIYLVINGLRTLEDVELNEDIFAKVVLENSLFTSITKVFSEPLDRLEELEVKWLDEFGNLINFGGLDNSFTLEIVQYQDKLKNADFSSQRGIRNYETGVDRVIHKVAVN